MGLTQATAMVVGIIVGSSIFVQPSEVSRAVPSFSGMLLVWVAAGALTWFLALGLPVAEACARAAHHGAAVLGSLEPVDAQLPLGP